jgi:hypothetical protein
MSKEPYIIKIIFLLCVYFYFILSAIFSQVFFYYMLQIESIIKTPNYETMTISYNFIYLK